MDTNLIQEQINKLKIIYIKKLHDFQDIPKNFKPWESNLSPSALYNCSLTCRKKIGYKTAETKMISLKRWVSVTPSGIMLPTGIYYSVKRKEDYEAYPEPHFKKTDYIIMMFPYGNVWSHRNPNQPITDEWLFSDINGQTILELLMEKDAAYPLVDYFKLCYDFMIDHPDMIGIHQKRAKKSKPNKNIQQITIL
jgi:hypothetical protein